MQDYRTTIPTRPNRTGPIFRGRGFTLVEILIVVVILGILASIVLPMFNTTADAVRQGAFIADVRVFADAAYLYMQETGEYLEDSSSGTLPTGWAPYIEEDKWVQPTPIGGVWDFEQGDFGFTSSFGVHFDGTGDTRDDPFMLEIDRIKDNNDLASGGFQKIAADRYYFVVEP